MTSSAKHQVARQLAADGFVEVRRAEERRRYFLTPKGRRLLAWLRAVEEACADAAAAADDAAAAGALGDGRLFFSPRYRT